MTKRGGGLEWLQQPSASTPSGTIRNTQCICGSGRKTKHCHGVDFVRLRVQQHDAPGRGRWGAFLDDTEVNFDTQSGVDTTAGVKSWHALLVPPASLQAFMTLATRLVTQYTECWNLDELHWHDLMNNKELRDRVQPSDLVSLAGSIIDLIEDVGAFVVMHSNGGSRQGGDEVDEALRTVSGLRTGDARDDLALHQLLTWVYLVTFGDTATPAGEILVAIDQRSGRSAAGSTRESPIPGTTGGVVHFAGTDWPEVQIVDLIAFGYQRVLRDVARGKVSGPYRDLVPVFSRLVPRTFSAQMTFQRADFTDIPNSAGIGLERSGPAVVEADFFDYLMACHERCVRRGLVPAMPDPQATMEGLLKEWKAAKWI